MKCFKVLAVGVLFFGSLCYGGTFNLLGIGSENQSMGNATVALPVDGFSQVYNPALMSQQPKKLLSISFETAFTSFNNINQVVVDTPALGASSVTTGNVDTSTLDTELLAVGYQTAITSGENPLHFGLTAMSPIKHIFYTNTADPFYPQYSLYSADTQRFGATVNFSKQIISKLSVGLGGSMYLTQGFTSQNRLPSGENSTSRFAGEIKAGIAPVVGALYELTPALKLGLSYHGKQDYRTTIEADTQTTILVNPSIDLIFTGTSSIDYDPDMILLGASYVMSDWTFALAAKAEFWAGYSGNYVALDFQTWNNSFSQALPSTPFQNIVTLHGGAEKRFERARMSAGYAFVPTPVPDQSGDSNILDSDKHEVYAGWGWIWPEWAMDGTLRLDLVGYADILVPRTITKVSGQLVGAPGYTISGFIYGGGLTLTREY